MNQYDNIIYVRTYTYNTYTFHRSITLSKNPNLLRMRLASTGCLVEGSDGLRSATAAEFAFEAQGNVSSLPSSQ